MSIETMHRVLAALVVGGCLACGEPRDALAPETEIEATQAKPAPQPDPATLTWYIPSTGTLGVRGDGLASYTDASGTTRYKDQECVSSAYMFTGGSGDAVMQNAMPSYHPKNCPYPRKVTFTLYNADPVTGDLTVSGSPAANPAYLIVLAIQNPTHVMPVGGPWELHDAGSNDGGRCGRLAFRPNLEDGTPVGADPLMVRRTAADTWEVQSQPNTIDAGGNVVRHDKAWCSSDNTLYSAPVSYVIKSAGALPTS